MNGRARLLGAALTAAVCLGCSQNHYAQWKKLDVVYASQVPIYPGALVDDAMGGSYYGEGLNDKVSETMTYWFKIDPKNHDQIVAFYDKEMPQAHKTVDDEGNVQFELTPQGAEDGEKVWVTVQKDKLRIGEETKPGKHKET
jgi:hypothetical protein